MTPNLLAIVVRGLPADHPKKAIGLTLAEQWRDADKAYLDAIAALGVATKHRMATETTLSETCHRCRCFIDELSEAEGF